MLCNERPEDRFYTLNNCMRAVVDLMIPEKTFTVVERDNVALLLHVLETERQAAFDAWQKPNG